MVRKVTVLALLASAGAALTAVRRRGRGKEEIDLWREATSAAGAPAGGR
ncbi:transporter [Frankia sp. CcI156]|nr:MULTISPECIES: DLW-39 family protein [Frankia]KEZ36192.1 hypothetical protein CEDDRAFT_02371 [Frankia sp. CeD]KFB06883.1 hypothetical protein ALLO2DRAFT_00170 [Frankia sp. Allo2]OFB44104.1 transporter [Frankia sp. CgIM4]OHV54977.1 transporter [Frankia sp. CgIS1]ONH27221.1 transporter [Frankia sp. CcI156]